MGISYVKRCKKCKRKIYCSSGTGWVSGELLVDTIKQAKEGRKGKVLYEFFREHGNGIIDVEQVSFLCEDCGEISKGYDWTMYIPDKNASDGTDYDPLKDPKYFQESYLEDYDGSRYMEYGCFDYSRFMEDVKKSYRVYSKYPHTCKKCKGKKKIVDIESKMYCPECKVKLDDISSVFWD